MFRFLLNLLLLLTVALLDYVTGSEVQFGSFYLLTVAIAAWSLRPRALALYALTVVTVWIFAGSLMGTHFSQPWKLYWNIVNRLGTVVIVATAVSMVRATLDRQRRLIRELGQASLSVSELRELIPLCRLCHKGQVGPDYEPQLQRFLREDPDADSVGGVCPDCRRARAGRIANIPLGPYFPTDPA